MQKMASVTELVAHYMQLSSKRFSSYPNLQRPIALMAMPTKGDVFRNPDLANTLKTIARKGRKGFYEGPVAKTIAQFIKDQGGFLTYNDLKTHTSEWITPVSTNYRGYDVWELPPNGQGIAALQILNLLEGYDI